MFKTVTRNFGWKLMSVLVAFVSWLMFTGARELTTSLSVPVQYRNIPKDLEISSDPVEKVHLVLRGPSPLLSRISATAVPVVIDLGTVDMPGQRTMTINRGSVSLPTGVTLERAIPGQIQLRLERRLTREVAVELWFEGGAKAPPGVGVQPDRLTVVGPESRVRLIERVHTDPIDLHALEASKEIHVSAYSGDTRVNFTSSPVVTVQWPERGGK